MDMETPCTHPDFGPGKILKTRYQGGESLVEFKSGSKIWVRTTQLTLLPSDPTSKIPDAILNLDALLPNPIDALKKQENAIPPDNSSHSHKPIPDKPFVPVQTKSKEKSNNEKKIISTISRDRAAQILARRQNPSHQTEIKIPILQEAILTHETDKVQINSHIEKEEIIHDPINPRIITKKLKDSPSTYTVTRVATSPPLSQNKNPVPSDSTKELIESNQIITHQSAVLSEFEARVIIESLRLGGVPYEHVDQFSSGRNEEISNITSFLDNSTGVFLIKGEYGVGKTHMLEMIRSLALKKRFLVSRVEIDPSEISFNKPKKIYQAFIKGMIYPRNGNVAGFREFIDDLFKSPPAIPFQKLSTHTYLGELITFWKQKGDNSELLEWIEARDDGSNQLYAVHDDGTPSKLPKLFDIQNAANLYCNIISGIGWAARHILELNGVVILFDEAEGIDPSLYTNYQFEKAANLMRGLIYMAQDNPALLKESGNALKVTRRSPNASPVLEGSLTKLIYNQMERTPSSYLFAQKSYTKLVFSFVPSLLERLQNQGYLDDVLEKIPSLDLESLGEKDYEHLYASIMRIYQISYGFDHKESYYPHIPRDKTRLFVKGVIEALDLKRAHPEKPIQQLLYS